MATENLQCKFATSIPSSCKSQGGVLLLLIDTLPWTLANVYIHMLRSYAFTDCQWGCSYRTWIISYSLTKCTLAASDGTFLDTWEGGFYPKIHCLPNQTYNILVASLVLKHKKKTGRSVAQLKLHLSST